MTPDCFCTERETVVDSRRRSSRYLHKLCVEAHLRQSHTSKWHTDTHMATAVVLGAAPTLTSVAGLPAVPGAVPTHTDTLSLHKKRSSSQTKYFYSMTGYTLHIWPNGSISGVKSMNNSTRKYAMLEFVTTLVTMSNIWKMSGDSEEKDPKVEIRGVESKMWLCMNKSGVLYGSKRKTADCEFHEEFDRNTGWNNYYSVQHPENVVKSVKWYIALNKRGRTRVAMSSKHKSSRFKTAGTQTNMPLLFNIDWVTPSKSKSYRRTPSKRKTRPNMRIFKETAKDTSSNSKLSLILNSIEKVLAQPKSQVSEETHADSMLIDLGKNNPFSNIKSDEKLRHKYKNRRRKSKSYRRRKPRRQRQR